MPLFDQILLVILFIGIGAILYWAGEDNEKQKVINTALDIVNREDHFHDKGKKYKDGYVDGLLELIKRI